MAQSLQYYIECFGQMNCNKRNGETAPHKAVMLMAVIEEVQAGYITNGFVPLTDRMVRAFKREWRRWVGVSKGFRCKFEYPFLHLNNEPFWDLMRREPFEHMAEYPLCRLRENFYGAKIPDELCEYMADETCRQKLKLALIERYLPDNNRQAVAAIAAETQQGYSSTIRDASTMLRA